VPTAVICTPGFASLGQAEAEALGIPSLPIVAASLEAPQDALDEVVHVLTQPRERLAAAYRGRYPPAESTIRPKPLFAADSRAPQGAAEAGAELFGGNSFRDPWGNLLQVVDYREVQFTKSAEILRGMGLYDLEKTETALTELRAKGLSGS